MTDFLSQCPTRLGRFGGALALAAPLVLAAPLALGLAGPASAQRAAPSTAQPNTADYILAVVNQELVTNAELQQRLAGIREDAARSRTPLPPAPELRKQVLDALIVDRVQVTNARENGPRIDEAELDRAVESVAQQNQLTLPQLRERLKQQGLEYGKFRNNIRDQLQVERLREKEVNARIRISNDEIDELIAKRKAAAGTSAQLNIAQILVTVPEGASDAVVAERQQRAQAALARVQAGETFEAVAREVSEDGNRAAGGRDRPAPRRPPARRLRRGGAVAETGAGAADAAAQWRRLPRAEARRPHRGQRLRDRPDARPAHPAAAVDRVEPGPGRAAAGRLQARDRRRHADLRTTRPRELAGTARPTGAATSAGPRRASSSPSSRTR